MRRSRMKCPSLFHFYRAYLGGHSSGKVHFARAIVETGKQVSNVFQNKSWQTCEQYTEYQYALPLAKGFLGHFRQLCEEHYEDRIFEELQWFNNQIVIPEHIVGKREVYIPFSYGYSSKEKKLVFLEYGKLDKVEKWLAIFKTLTESFALEHVLPDLEHVDYWNLMNGTSVELSYPESFLAPKHLVVQTAKELEDQQSKKRGVIL